MTFSFAGIDSQWLYQRLMQAGVVCAARGGGVRWSPHFYTSQEVLDRALGILRDLLQEAGGSLPVTISSVTLFQIRLKIDVGRLALYEKPSILVTSDPDIPQAPGSG